MQEPLKLRSTITLGPGNGVYVRALPRRKSYWAPLLHRLRFSWDCGFIFFERWLFPFAFLLRYLEQGEFVRTIHVLPLIVDNSCMNRDWGLHFFDKMMLHILTLWNKSSVVSMLLGFWLRGRPNQEMLDTTQHFQGCWNHLGEPILFSSRQIFRHWLACE